jgi:hypothetical protein
MAYFVWGKYTEILNVGTGGTTDVLCRLLGNRIKVRGLDLFF